jgi:hypothetical protein
VQEVEELVVELVEVEYDSLLDELVVLVVELEVVEEEVVEVQEVEDEVVELVEVE